MSCQLFPAFLLLVVCLLVSRCMGHLINVTAGSGPLKLARPDKDVTVNVDKQSVNFVCPEIPPCPEPKCPDVKCPDPSSWLKLLRCPDTPTTPCPQVTEPAVVTCPETTSSPEPTQCPETPTTCPEAPSCPETTQCPEAVCPSCPTTVTPDPTTPQPTPDSGLEVLNNLLDDDGWIVFQRRVNGEVDFYRGWQDYKVGFGDVLNGDFWLGNERIHTLTSRGKWQLRVEIAMIGIDYYSEYSTFSVASEEKNYRLTVRGNSGTAGNILGYHKGREFSTYDRDNDRWTGGNCAKDRQGAWWFIYKDCAINSLNGLWGSSDNVKGVTSIDYSTPATSTVMKMRPVP